MKRHLLALAVAAALAVTGRAAARPWTLLRGAHATIIGQQSAKTLHGVALQIEQFRAVVGGLIQNAQRPLPAPTVVYVFGARKEMEPFLPLHNGRPVALGGYFYHDPEVNYIAMLLDESDDDAQIVFHEYTHLLLRNAAPSIPAWLNEGLAEYYSTYKLDASGTRADIGRPVGRHVALLRERFLPVAQLIAVDVSSDLYNEGERRSVFYAESWALVHYLMAERLDGGAVINRYMSAITDGRAPDEAFTRAFGMTPDVFEKELRTYVRRPAFKSVSFVFPQRLRVETTEKSEAIGDGEAEAWLGDLQRRAGRGDEAAVRIEASLKAAPEAAMPHLALALLEVSRDHLDKAVPSFTRAAALAPDDFLVQYAYGVTLLRDKFQTGVRAEDVAAAERARTALARAASVNPASSDAFAYLAFADMVVDGRLAEARIAIAHAIELAPARLDYRLRAADISVLQDKVDEARAVLTVLARVTTDATVSDGAKARLEQLDERDARMRARAAAIAEAAARVAAAEAAAAASTRASADRPAGPETRVVLTPADHPGAATDVKDDAPAITLRKVQRGEERAYGELTRVECAAGAVRFHLKVGSREIVSTAKRLGAVAVTVYGDAKDAVVACGVHEPPDAVYLTWRSAPTHAEAGVTLVGEAIAVEFVPPGFTP